MNRRQIRNSARAKTHIARIALHEGTEKTDDGDDDEEGDGKFKCPSEAKWSPQLTLAICIGVRAYVYVLNVNAQFYVCMYASVYA